MNWQQSAIEDLQNYEARKDSLKSIRERIKALNCQYESTKCATTDSTPVQGGASRIEEHMVDNILERERLKKTYYATKKLVELVEKGLARLNPQELEILEKFYIYPAKGNINRLVEKFGYEQRQIYRMKDKALYKFTIATYGLIDY